MIETHYFWWNIFSLMIGTIIIRGSIIALSAKIKISERIRELFTFIPAAILPAFVAPAVFFHSGRVEWAFGKERLLIIVLASVVCLLVRSTLATVCFGLIMLYALTQFF